MASSSSPAVELLLGVLRVGLGDEAPGLADEERLAHLAAGAICALQTLLTMTRLVAFGFGEVD